MLTHRLVVELALGARTSRLANPLPDPSSAGVIYHRIDPT